MNLAPRTAALLLVLAACGDDGGGGAGSLTAREADYYDKLDAVCARANECYQPDAQPDDLDWCDIPTSKSDDGETSISFNSLESEPCLEEVRKKHADGYRKSLDCGLMMLERAEAALRDECPEAATELAEWPPCQAELLPVYQEINETLEACRAADGGA